MFKYKLLHVKNVTNFFPENLNWHEYKYCCNENYLVVKLSKSWSLKVMQILLTLYGVCKITELITFIYVSQARR